LFRGREFDFKQMSRQIKEGNIDDIVVELLSGMYQRKRYAEAK